MKHFFWLLVPVLLINACGDSGKPSKKLRKAMGGNAYYGGVVRTTLLNAPTTLFPPVNGDVYSSRVSIQVYEGLVRVSPRDFTMQPCLAESWEVNDSATVFTFNIRKGIKFHDDPCFSDGRGRELTAHDIKFCFEKLCEDFPSNHGFWIFKGKVKGADEYHRLTAEKKPTPDGVSGFTVLDNYTFRITLDYPFAGFLNVLVTPHAGIYPKEAFDKYGELMNTRCVGTGPYRLPELKDKNSILLVKNEQYWDRDADGNKLPFLDGIRIDLYSDPKVIYTDFLKGKIDMTSNFPPEMVDEVKKAAAAGEYKMTETDALYVYYLGLNHQEKPFDDIRIRQSFNYAIDRDRIVKFVFRGTYKIAKSGMVPQGFAGFPYSEVTDITYDPDRAKKLLEEAGYPGGKGFPKISLCVLKSNEGFAQVVQEMLSKNLNIKIDIRVTDIRQRIDLVNRGDVLFWDSGWFADYPDPENFLNLFYGKHVSEDPKAISDINASRYKSTLFDSLFTASLKQSDIKKRYLLYAKALQVSIDDAVVIPYQYGLTKRIYRNDLENIFVNAQDLYDFREVYFAEEKVE